MTKDTLLRNVEATMAMENMPITEAHKLRLRRYLDVKLSLKEVEDEILREYNLQ